MRSSKGGGVTPPRVTLERKPEDWSARRSLRWRFVEGMDVRPRRALEAFWRCEQTWARLTSDILKGMASMRRVGCERPTRALEGLHQLAVLKWCWDSSSC